MPSPTRRRFLAALGAAGLVSTAGCVAYDRPSHEGRWPTEDSSFVTDREAPGSDAYVAWSRALREGSPRSAPAVVDGVLYHLNSATSTGDGDDDGGTWLTALNAATGETAWETRLWKTSRFYDRYHQGSPVADGDTLFAQTHGGVKAVSVDGELKWTFENLGPEQPTPDVAPPLVTDELVVAGSYGTDADRPERLYGIDRETGDEVWRRTFGTTNDRVLWQLTLDGDTVYAPLFSGGPLFAVDAATGETKRKFDVRPARVVRPTDDLLLVPVDSAESVDSSDADDSDAPESLVALDPASGAVRWREAAEFWGEGSVTTTEGRVYYAEYRSVIARELATGEELWRFGGETCGPRPDTTPVLTGDSLYATGFRVVGADERTENCVFVLDPDTGEERGRITWPHDRSVTTPAFVDGAMYLADSDGELLCLEDCAAGAFGRCLLG